MLRDIKFPEKYYVGFQKQRFSQEENFRMLGFATPNTGDYAFKKRKATVDSWSEKGLTPLDMENKAVHGFKLVDAVSRYSTSNKMFRVEDPRGFELEIDVYNLLDIIQKHTIVQGTIMEPMLWGRYGNNNYLISSNSDEYKHHVNGAKVTSLVPGIWMKNKAGNVLYRFEGRMAYNLVAASVYRKDLDERSYYYHWNQPRTDFSKVTTKVKTIVNRKQDKPAYIYSEFHLDENGVTRYYDAWYRRDTVKPYQRANIVIRKTEIKDLIPVDESEVKCEFAKSFVVPIGERLRGIEYDYRHHDTDEVLNVTNYTVEMNMSAGDQTVPVLFKTKADSMNKPYDQQELLDYFKPLKYQSYYYGERSPNYFGTVTYVHEDSAISELTKEE